VSHPADFCLLFVLRWFVPDHETEPHLQTIAATAAHCVFREIRIVFVAFYCVPCFRLQKIVLFVLLDGYILQGSYFVADLITKDFPSEKQENKVEWKGTTANNVVSSA
jgi:hypothetical protein